MEVQPWKEYDPVRVDQIVFQFARSVASAGGNASEPTCGTASPGNNDVAPVVGDDATVVARPCSAFGTEAISWDSCVPMFEAAEVPVACEAAAACTPVPEVVCGGSVNGVSCEAVAAEPA
jgi:hypothetical protein